ncbi:Crp/Fnr family transcriptional regulator [Jiangella aurantiaca]|uniref:Crp/Fnr family transcriptional regulator n=1 Tax=Jiangella aurantiaca TaxID=2530373 RepID=UPI00193DC900|nr:Crp/Fnr family transcriptional regulator [Jiangella aurantiaca]
MTILRSTKVFGELSPAALAELVPHLRERTFATNQVVWLEGDPADALYILADGALKSHRTSREGHEVILIFNSVGDVAGEVGLFHPAQVRHVNVTAMAPTRCLTIGREPLLGFLSRHPQAMLRMLEQIATVAVKAASSYSGLAFNDIRGRVAAALLALADEYGERTPTGVRIRLRLSQATLAALVAASRENVNRALAGFLASGAVSYADRQFEIHDPTALETARNLP